MLKEEIFPHVDHTLLKPCATWPEVQRLCDEAVQYHTATVCVPQYYIGRIKQTYGNAVRVCTVVGFPLGYNSTDSKAAEAQCAIRDGADEVDMVINLCMVKEQQFSAVRDEIAAVKQACGSTILKVIVETCYLTNPEKERLCMAVREGGAEYIKTSTGFGTGGATLADVQLFRRCLAGSSVKIKASGGIKTRAELEAFLEAGCDRLGTSAAVSLLTASNKTEKEG